jgi:hypothetical protein
MQRNQAERRVEDRRSTERDAAQQLGGQPPSVDDDDALESPDYVPSFLTARELQAREPAKGEGPAEERRKAARRKT